LRQGRASVGVRSGVGCRFRGRSVSGGSGEAREEPRLPEEGQAEPGDWGGGAGARGRERERE
jgi:hypothetical protein